MSLKVVFGLFICGIYLCSANPVQIGDDRSNWEAVWKEIKDEAVSRSGDSNVFDEIVRINAEARGAGIGRSDDQLFLFEGDIVMNPNDTANLTQNDRRSRQRRGVINTRNGQFLWQKNVAYAIGGSLSAHGNTIKGAIKEFEQTLNCLGDWQDVTSTTKPRDYMYFFKGSGCYSQIGKVNGKQKISIGKKCVSHGIVVHEIGHALGLYHEQSRPDRDNYVTILWDNIIPEMKFNFNKQPSSRINSFNVSYDYGSIMHYGAYAFSKNRQRTILSKQAGVQLGQRRGLSEKDKEQLRKLYGCTTTATVKPTLKPTGNQETACAIKYSLNYPECDQCLYQCFIKGPSNFIQGCQGNLKSDEHCNYWKSLGFCESRFVKFMMKNCCKACSVVSCTDKNTNCSDWASYGFCATTSKYSTFMKKYCAKSCGCV